MARTVDQINESILNQVANDSTLSTQLTSTSRRAIWRLWAYQMALAQATFEQLVELEKDNIDDVVLTAPAGNPYWVQQKMFLFQYDNTTPQYVQLNTTTFAYQYPTVNESLRIITRCSVDRSIYNTVQVKVAKSSTPEPLTSPEIAAAQNYIDTIGVAGVNYQIISLEADRFYISADIYYKGQYSTVIEANVIAAITDYLSNIDFNGRVILTDVEIAIKSVTGVNDVVLNMVRARKETVPILSATYLVENKTELQRSWQTVAGYIIPEDTSGSTLSDTLTFIAE